MDWNRQRHQNAKVLLRSCRSQTLSNRRPKSMYMWVFECVSKCEKCWPPLHKLKALLYSKMNKSHGSVQALNTNEWEIVFLVLWALWEQQLNIYGQTSQVLNDELNPGRAEYKGEWLKGRKREGERRTIQHLVNHWIDCNLNGNTAHKIRKAWKQFCSNKWTTKCFENSYLNREIEGAAISSF